MIRVAWLTHHTAMTTAESIIPLTCKVRTAALQWLGRSHGLPIWHFCDGIRNQSCSGLGVGFQLGDEY